MGRWGAFKERVTPEVSRQLEEEALQFRNLGLRLGLTFRDPQEETLEGCAACDESVPEE